MRLALLALALLTPTLQAQWDVKDVMIPTRDGVKLHTVLYTPRNAAGPLPILFSRTPYGAPKDDAPAPRYADLADGGYIFAFQDVRGRFRSEGQFVMQRAPRAGRSDPRAIDESTDAYDSIDWLIKNVPHNNGRVGMLGISYDGWLTAMALIDPHPALRAASEQASPADMFLGDDFHHNGAFRLSYGFEYAAEMETSKDANTMFAFDQADTYSWYLRLGPLYNANEKYFKGKIPTWNDFVNHPNYDEFWKKQAIGTYIGEPKVPNLNVAGWWDQEDFYGPVKIYELFEKNDRNHRNYLVAGPWNHGGWARGQGDKLGDISFDAATAKAYRRDLEAPWFAFWLKDKGKGDFAEATVFETGRNRWERYDSWPPKTARPTSLYFAPAGDLSPTAPGSAPAFDSYVSDPAHPVPYRNRPISATYQGPAWRTWLLEDQRFVDNRPDVLTFSTGPLAEDLHVAGNVTAEIFASTTGSDADWVVKLIDVYPEKFPEDPKLAGFELMISNEVFRGRFRESFETPKALVPGQVNAFPIDLHSTDHTFLKGHRIMVQVQSSWFPLIDRNPQTFVDNIFNAREADYKSAEHRVFRSGAQASRVILPVIQ